VACRGAFDVPSLSIRRPMLLPEATGAYAAAKVATSSCRKGLFEEAIPKGIRVVRVSPARSEITTAVGLVDGVAAITGTDLEAPDKVTMDSLDGASRSNARLGRRKRRT
jgi:NAD(P)-dependent dehydrogenase (short-subunit alcohol dehydrogenase family)